MVRKIQGYGWVPDLPDLPDQRDRRYAAPRRVLAALPRRRDLRRECPPVLGRGELGSRTANANARRYDRIKQGSAGYALLATGYDDSKQHFIVMNSWSAGWGDKGYFYLPYAYATDAGLADDFRTVRVVET